VVVAGVRRARATFTVRNLREGYVEKPELKRKKTRTAEPFALQTLFDLT
jgi:hypothetical protein